MKALTVAALVVASVLTSPYAEAKYVGNVGPGAILLWPTARSTALAGAMTGLADEADAAFFNPAGLAFQTTAKASLSYGNWLPGLYPGMLYGSAIGGAPIRLPILDGHSAYISGNLTCLTAGETDIVNERGKYLGRVTTWGGTAGFRLAILLSSRLGAGVGLKVLHDSRYWDWGWGIQDEGTAAAADFAVLYRPLSRISIGAAIDNLGPTLVYRPSGEPDDLPRIARIGLCWTGINSRDVRLRVMPELDKLLLGMFRDTTGRKPLGRQLQGEWHDVRKAIGIEATAFDLLSLRLGYFEDLTNQLGGVVLENKDGQTYHYGLWDALSRKGLGQTKSIGLCWGFGIGYKDYFRVDVSSDAAIYDFDTSNWKLTLVANDIAGGIRELRQDRVPWEE
jgi:hypothetical protein